MMWTKSTFSGGGGSNCVEVCWQTSSYSSGGDCVEVGWEKSSHSLTNRTCVEVGFAASASCAGGECVEVGWQASTQCTSGGCVEAAHLAGKTVLIRDSKDPTGPWLSVDAGAWHAFLDAVSDGYYDPAP